MIYISPERYESVDCEYWKIFIVSFRDGVIRHYVRVPFTFFRFFLNMVKWMIFKQLYFRDYSTDLADIHIARIVWIGRFWISKADFDYLFPSWSNQPFWKGTIHIIVYFYRNSKILAFLKFSISSVYRLIWMIFISPELYESVFESVLNI